MVIAREECRRFYKDVRHGYVAVVKNLLQCLFKSDSEVVKCIVRLDPNMRSLVQDKDVLFSINRSLPVNI